MLIALAMFTTKPLFAQTYNVAGDRHVRELDVFRECDVCPEMVVLPLGQFEMGAHPDEAAAAYKAAAVYSPQAIAAAIRSEGPQRTVSVDIPISMGRTEVTRRQWTACVAAGGCAQGLFERPRQSWARCLNTKGCTLTPDDHLRFRLPKGPHQWHPDSPIRMLTFSDMSDYVTWLNETIGEQVYRLPTEAEWEYAARAGTTTQYAEGDMPTREQANFAIRWREKKDGKTRVSYDPSNMRMPVPVDHLDAANAWGLRHMSGNVSELTRSCWSKRHLSLYETSRHLAASYRPLGCRRVYKGGSFWSEAVANRPARRLSVSEKGHHFWLGFRVVRDLTNVN